MTRMNRPSSVATMILTGADALASSMPSRLAQHPRANGVQTRCRKSTELDRRSNADIGPDDSLEAARLPGATSKPESPAAAALIRTGASPTAVQRILGHRSAAFTLTVYGHIFDADLDMVADNLDRTSRDVARLRASRE